jgi:FixJ family two-component response regulator
VLYVIEADAAVRDAMCRLATSLGIRALAFASVEQFVEQSSPDVGGCVLLDSSILGEAGRITVKVRDWPVIVMCGNDSRAAAARTEARKLGARLMLSKPIDSQALFDVVTWVTEDDGRSLLCNTSGVDAGGWHG